MENDNRITEKNNKLTAILMEISEYVRSAQQYSYYELKAYMLENRPEWEEAFNNKNTRAAISEYLKSAKRSKGVKTRPMYESVQILNEVEERMMDTQAIRLKE